MQQGLVQSKVLDRVMQRQQILAKQLEEIRRDVAKLDLWHDNFSPRSIARDAFSPALGSWDEGVEPPTSSPMFGLGTSSMFPSAREVSNSNHCAMSQQRNVQGVFKEVHHKEVIWDDELIHNIDSHDGLLNQLVQGRELVCDELLPGLETQADFFPVEDDESIHSIGTQEGLLQQLAMGMCDENTKGSTHVLLDGMSRQDVPQEGYDEMLGKVVWDEEISAELNMKNDLLQLRSSGEGYPDDVQLVDGSSGSMQFGLIDADHIFVQELDDNKVVWDGDFHNSDDKLPAIWDDKLPADLALHDGLLKQLASRMQCIRDKKANQAVKLDTCQPSATGTHQEGNIILLLPSNKSSDSVGDFESLELHMPTAQLGKSWFTLIVHLINGWSPYLPPFDEIKKLLVFLEQSMEANISLYRSPFSTNILQELTEKLCQDNLLTDIGSSSLSHDLDPDDNESNRLEEPVWGTTKGRKRGTNLLANITANDIFDDLSNGQKLNYLDESLINCTEIKGSFGLGEGELCKMAFPVRWQWDPGITCCYVVWKQLMNTATAWGQAVFLGDSNVMT